MKRQSPILTTQESLLYRAETELEPCYMRHDTYAHLLASSRTVTTPIDYSAGKNGESECLKHLDLPG